MSSKMFISYRRGDSFWAANAIHTFLVERFGAENVFKDLESIKPGEPWEKALNAALDTCELMLVLIGDEWTTCKSGFWSKPRIKQKGDMVRKEISFSLEKEIPVVPVLLDETQLPAPKALPEDIKGLRDLQAARISKASFRGDLENLIERCGLRDKNQPVLAAQSFDSSGGSASNDALLVKFLSEFKQWAFSPLRIQKWGGEQFGYEPLSQLSTDEIRSMLERHEDTGLIETRKSKKGNTLYTVKKGAS